ncbi:RDD family protein [Georgenia faecalis]|uniref:RDD family protein n=1 Tax=Georgenia faecalis TaxID=2483799 RepID=UPI000FDA23B1|nr:RDD family protein [Georgenia faecalis]
MLTGAAPTPGGSATAGTAGLPPDLIVTGEAVALEIRPASFLLRMLGGLLDAAVYVAVLIALVLALASSAGTNQARLQTLTIVSLVAVVIIVPTAVETLTRGRSLGKLATGVRIVRDDGGPIRFRHAFIRALTGFGELWLTVGSVAVVCALVNSRGKRVGDLLAGTYAARVRDDGRRPAPLVMPPELAAWAATADIRALPDGLALAARRFLDRTGSMEPGARRALGSQLAARIEPLVAPPPPWGTHPERFVAAVLVARRDREYAVGSAAQQRIDAETAELRRLPHEIPD